MGSDQQKNGNMTHILRGLAVMLVGSYLTAATTWMFIHASIIAGLNANHDALKVRIERLETGETTPMAAATRSEFTAVWRELDRMRKQP